MIHICWKSHHDLYYDFVNVTLLFNKFNYIFDNFNNFGGKIAMNHESISADLGDFMI